MSDKRGRKRQRASSKVKQSLTHELKDLLQPSEFTLSNGIKMPSIGVGINQWVPESVLRHTVDQALQAGYRLFDTSSRYGNEANLWKILKELLPKYTLQRSDVFITSRLAPGDFGCSTRINNAFIKSYENLGADYIDLYLIDNPGKAKLVQNDVKKNKLINITWSELVQMYNQGKVNALGVSNFNVRMLENLLNCSYGIEPTVNKVEWHPYNSEKELYKLCKENDILIQADSTLESPKSADMLKDPSIVKIAKSLEVKPSELVLGWTLKRDVAVIPRAGCLENVQVDDIPLDFKIPEKDMSILNALAEKKSWSLMTDM